MLTRTRLVSGVLAMACAAVVVASAVGQSPASDRILFIGNSLTSANNLPALVLELATAAGHRVSCQSIAFPNFSLEDHWNQGDARAAIAKGGWRTVILQQGPSALPESQVLLREYTKRFHAEITRAGARTALYMVWPSDVRRFDFDGVIRSYTNAAADVKGLLLPVGQAWQAVWARDPTVALYGPDGFHPSPAATYLAALVIVRGLTGDVPAGVPRSLSIAPVQARLMQDVVARLTR